MTINPTYSLSITDMRIHPWFKEDDKGIQNPYEELTMLRPHNAIVAAMEYIVF